MILRDMLERATAEANSADPVEVFRRGILDFIHELAVASDTFAGMAGVGGIETAGSLISYLAAHPEKIDLFMQQGIFGLMDGAPGGPRDLHAQGCLTWHRKGDGKVTTPQELRIGLIVRDLAKPKS